MKTVEYYRPTMELEYPSTGNYTNLVLELKGANDKVFDTVNITESEYNWNKRDYKGYNIISSEYNSSEHLDATKEFEKVSKEHKKLLKERNYDMVVDLAKENNANVDIVQKAILCLDCACNEFNNLRDHIKDNYPIPDDKDYYDFLFEKEIELITKYLNILKD